MTGLRRGLARRQVEGAGARVIQPFEAKAQVGEEVGPPPSVSGRWSIDKKSLCEYPKSMLTTAAGGDLGLAITALALFRIPPSGSRGGASPSQVDARAFDEAAPAAKDLDGERLQFVQRGERRRGMR